MLTTRTPVATLMVQTQSSSLLAFSRMAVSSTLMEMMMRVGLMGYLRKTTSTIVFMRKQWSEVSWFLQIFTVVIVV